MAKIDTFDCAGKLAPFKIALGVLHDEVLSDCKAFVGDHEKDVVIKSTGWKAGAKGKFTSKDGYTLTLPLNNPLTILLNFGGKLADIAGDGEFILDAELPKLCSGWFTEKSRKFAARQAEQQSKETAPKKVEATEKAEA